MKKLFFYICLSLTLLMVGCAAPIKASSEKDAAAKDFTTAKNNAVLYIYRNENFGAAVGMPVKVNGADIGETGAKTFFKLNLAAGMYAIESEAENTSQLPLTLVDGRNYFVWQEVRMGMLKARSALRQVDEKTGMAGVLESVLLTPKVSDESLSKSVVNIK